MVKKVVLSAAIILTSTFLGVLQPPASPAGPRAAEAQAPTTPTPLPATLTPGCPMTASGYPDIAGEWIEVSGFPSDGHTITVTQSDATYTAVGRYAIGDTNIAYRTDGTLTREGVLTERLVHTEGVLPSVEGFSQDRRLILAPDCNTIHISAESVGGGGEHQVSWRRASPLIALTETSAPTETMAPTETVEPHYLSEPCDPGIDAGARFSSISREVEVFPESDPGAIFSAKPNTVLHVDDHVMTGEDSHAIITFSDLSTLLVKAESEIIIACPGLQRFGLYYQHGTFWLEVKKLILGDAIEVPSNLAVTGINGTTIVTEVTDERTTLKVIEGEVEFTSLVTDEHVVVHTGEKVSATADGLSDTTTFDIEAESALWHLDGPNGDGLSSSLALGGVIVVATVVLVLAAAGFVVVRKRRTGVHP